MIISHVLTSYDEGKLKARMASASGETALAKYTDERATIHNTKSAQHFFSLIYAANDVAPGCSRSLSRSGLSLLRENFFA